MPTVNVRLLVDGVTIETCGMIVSVRDCVAIAVNESVAVTVKVCVVAAAVGLPLIVPVVGASVRPAGSDPVVTLQVYVPEPPPAVSVAV